MKRQTFNVLFFIRKTKLKKSGETPIMLRITIEGQLTELQLKRDVMPTQWNQAKERCTSRDATSIGKSSVSCPLKPSDSAPLKHSTMPP